MNFHKLTIKDIRNETAECISVAFSIPEELKDTFRFVQGQNITIKVFINDEEVRRSYSICSSPLENELRVAIKKVEGGKFSSYAHTLKKNDILEILPPTGKFYTELNPFHKKNYIAFAAGSGITPIISVIKTTLATEPKSSFTLIYGNKNRSTIIFKEELEAIKNRYMDRFVLHHILSREQTDAEINHGRITAKKCDALSEKLINIKNMDEFFICGPEQLIFSVKDWLEKNNIDRKKIHFELFTVPGEKLEVRSEKIEVRKVKDSEKISQVTIKQDGIAFGFELQYEDLSILDAAIKQGADLPFSCKGGVCSTCRAKLVEGKIEMEHNYSLEADELEQGFILTCQSHPRSEKVVIDFDVK
ncbi:MAG: phenylacetate-CoA oxygenase/reductase subunit PaaK [Bacteroidetes bacterium]|nr:phenylacetate-CoA oxygenase/reductase subunit PaaK [Bacteroidota bacterium]MBS1933988.1 phenylacetate-CoA oxygenase/reductase subunit PaaK [Bacteroidota bacterium]